MKMTLTYEEALGSYFRSDETYYSEALGTKLQPSYGLSDRTEADDGWHLRNTNGWLATVYDDGSVETFDDSDDLGVWLERNRATSAESYILDALAGT